MSHLNDWSWRQHVISPKTFIHVDEVIYLLKPHIFRETMCFMILSKRIVHPVFTCILKHLSRVLPKQAFCKLQRWGIARRWKAELCWREDEATSHTPYVLVTFLSLSLLLSLSLSLSLHHVHLVLYVSFGLYHGFQGMSTSHSLCKYSRHYIPFSHLSQRYCIHISARDVQCANRLGLKSICMHLGPLHTSNGLSVAIVRYKREKKHISGHINVR